MRCHVRRDAALPLCCHSLGRVDGMSRVRARCRSLAQRSQRAPSALQPNICTCFPYLGALAVKAVIRLAYRARQAAGLRLTRAHHFSSRQRRAHWRGSISRSNAPRGHECGSRINKCRVLFEELNGPDEMTTKWARARRGHDAVVVFRVRATADGCLCVERWPHPFRRAAN